ncbi:MAG: hypothetical protein GEU82_17240 [Luteitalea sp.]|nr:hypothetical protein [Luteitalea sp.]
MKGWWPRGGRNLKHPGRSGHGASFTNLGNAGGGGWQLVMLYLVLPGVLVGPPTMAMGAGFPLLQKVVLTDIDQVGRRVGFVLIANIVGSTVGTLATGWAALNVLGSSVSLVLITALSGLFMIAAATLAGAGANWRRQVPLACGGLAIVGVIAARIPDGPTLWARLRGAPVEWVVSSEDASGLSLLKTEAGNLGARTMVFVNGIGQSWIPFGNVHSSSGRFRHSYTPTRGEPPSSALDPAIRCTRSPAASSCRA